MTETKRYGKDVIIEQLNDLVNELGYNHFPGLADYIMPVSIISVENFKLVLEKATEDDLKDFMIIPDLERLSLWDREEKVVISIDGDRILYTPDRTKFSKMKVCPFNVDTFLNLIKSKINNEYELRYKIPLRMIDDSGNEIQMPDVLPENILGIENLLGQWDWFEKEPKSDQIEELFDLNYARIQNGFTHKDIKMSVTFDKGWYNVCFTSIIPVNSEVMNLHTYPKKETLRTAIERVFFGMVSDGIGENPIGEVILNMNNLQTKFEVWMGDPIFVEQ